MVINIFSLSLSLSLSISCLQDFTISYDMMSYRIRVGGQGAWGLTHWGRDKMAVIFQTTFSNTFSWMKMKEFRLRFHWSLFPRIKLTSLVSIIAWRRPGDKPLSEAMMASLLTHICVARPQWVKGVGVGGLLMENGLGAEQKKNLNFGRGTRKKNKEKTGGGGVGRKRMGGGRGLNTGGRGSRPLCSPPRILKWGPDWKKKIHSPRDNVNTCR